MLPPRAYSEPRFPLAGPHSSLAKSTEVRPVLIALARSSDLHLFPSGAYTQINAQTTADAIRLLQTARPRLLAVDLDLDGIDAHELCTVAGRVGGVSVLVVTSTPEKVPAVLRAGCHAVLLRPLTLNLVSARLGRLCRESVRGHQQGTNRVWQDSPCPTCGAGGTISFEYSSHRRMWYACQHCEAVWVGRRRE